MKTFDDRFQELWAQYSQEYDLDNLNANDRANVETLIHNTITAAIIQDKVRTLLPRIVDSNDSDDTEDILSTIAAIKKLQDSVKDLQAGNIQLEKQLGIDRKSRKKDSEATTGEYLLMIKSAARNWVDKRLIKLYCPDCNVMVGRVSPVHEHTAYSAYFQCSQCKKLVTITRQERDVFFDLAKDDREWRRKFPVEIKQPKRKKIKQASTDDEPEAEAELILEDDE